MIPTMGGHYEEARRKGVKVKSDGKKWNIKNICVTNKKDLWKVKSKQSHMTRFCKKNGLFCLDHPAEDFKCVKWKRKENKELKSSLIILFNLLKQQV